MRILFWSELFWPYIGGAEVFGANLVVALRERGCEVIVVTRRDSPNLEKETQYKGIPVYRFPFWSACADGDLDQWIEVRQQVARLKSNFAPDLVHLNSFGPSVLFHLETANTHPAPSLITFHGDRYQQAIAHDTLLEKTFQSADWVICVSAAVLDRARQLAAGIIPRSSFIHNGLERPPLLPDPLPLNPPQLLCLGRLVPEKGFAIALTAFASIVDRFPSVRLVIAGDGPARPQLEEQAAALGLTNSVDFVGWVLPEQIPRLINDATLVVVPSRWQEPFGLVALEAALMARPLVATNVGGLPELVVHERTGLLVDKDDSNGLVEAISFLLEHPDAAAQMGQAARRRAHEIFSLERCVNAYDTLYRKLITTAKRDCCTH